MFYDKFVLLCTLRGVSPSKAAVDAGISKSLVTKWKVNSIEIPSPEILKKLSTYFGVSVSGLLNEEDQTVPTLIEKEGHTMSDEELKFALWGDCQDIDEADLEDVKRYAAFVRERKNKK